MKIIKNEKLIKRNSIIGQWTSIGALIVLGGGMYMSFSNPSNPNMVTYSLIALVGGFILTQIGMYLGNRWGRSPRPDEKIDAGLKGLPGGYALYHFVTPASHLLVGPAGVWALIPYRQRGVVTYTKNRWRVGNGGFLQAYMSIFGQEGIGRPDLEAETEINAIHKLLAKKMTEGEIPDVNAALIFMHDEVDLQVEDAPLPAMKIKQLKDFMRQKAKEKSLGQVTLAAIKSALPE
ncbi:MAG: hypothetical protein ABI904_10970 [Chloroflexota bacterium]